MAIGDDMVEPGRLLLSLKVAHRVRAIARFRVAGATSAETAICLDARRDNPAAWDAMLRDGVLRAEGDRCWLDEARLGDEDTVSYAARVFAADWRAGAIRGVAVTVLVWLLF